MRFLFLLSSLLPSIRHHLSSIISYTKNPYAGYLKFPRHTDFTTF
ncbi:hypothetical protein RUMGNA_00679 [Mediterraneibacter gnavus ATCC 29149]|uniref:Uncharacterized protein n=1 Tax=Mediterraneibacter gnavus (strain ATCC 29149 / DSM 114966 / JCM 6515 / VPI C7-9) TaxID=411470 RepID=A7AZF8_MEDG7|nr:hypothetical protein RUMGNA_00679 [Mediterraneibacter gnavus ATCC 29149]